MVFSQQLLAFIAGILTFSALLCLAFVLPETDNILVKEAQINTKFFCIASLDIQCDPNLIKFYLYPNPESTSDYDELPYLNARKIRQSRYDPNRNVIIITHGFTQNFESDSPVTFRDGYLSNGYASSSNIIVVNWGELSGGYARTFPFVIASLLLDIPLYQSAVANVPKVGQRIGDFLWFLCYNIGCNGKLHLIGQSLGAHLSGIGARRFKELSGRQVDRVTGTDPAGPLFQIVNAGIRLNPRDGAFVEVVHTNQGEFGIIANLGHVDFKINGGGPLQPGCNPSNLTYLYCAHNLAPHFYAYSIGTTSLVGESHCQHSTICQQPLQTVFGENTPPGTRGVYDVKLDPGTTTFVVFPS